MKLSLLDKNTKTKIETLKKIIQDNKNQVANQDNSIKFNKSYDNLLSKAGLGNTLRGSREVILNTLKESNMITIPIKNLITGKASINQIEEFEFIRNNPMVSTLGAAALGGAIVHDYHKNGYNSVGKYIGDKIDTTKEAIGSGVDSVKKGLNNLTKDNGHKDNSFQQDNVMNHNTLNADV